MFELAQRNDALDSLPCKTLQEMKAAYNFQDLQSFLNLYYAGCAVLRTNQVSASLLWHLQGNLIPLLLVWLCSSKVFSAFPTSKCVLAFITNRLTC